MRKIFRLIATALGSGSSDMYFGIIAITRIGVVFNSLLQIAERRLTAWKPAVANA